LTASLLEPRNSPGAMRLRRIPSRQEFFAGLLFLACLNGLMSRIVDEVTRLGLAFAVFGTLGVSVIVWISLCAGIALILQSAPEDMKKLDLVVAIPCLLLIALPYSPLSWIALGALCAYIFAMSDAALTRQGAIILLAASVPMLWSRLLFKMFSTTILSADAMLVSWLLGTSREGNVVEFADKSGHLVVLAPCSSLANVSLAILCWITVSRLVNHEQSKYDVFWCLLACMSVIFINTVRMALMGMSEPFYNSLHSDIGSAVLSLLISTVIITICLLGVRRELFVRI
jgi:hypothetical protein